jgi:DNA-binding transcriptional MerR regulator
MEDTELFNIGQLARRTGVSVRTIRFWSDIGLVPPACRSEGGYRLYDAEAVGRLDLVRTLRDLGLRLDDIEQILRGRATVARVAEVHAAALDAEIRILRLRRAVLRAVVKRASSMEETRLMHKLAKLSAQQRQQIIDEFVDRAFAGIDVDAAAAGIARGMRRMPMDLPDDPSPEQVDAWIELAELVGDEDFQRRVREMVVAGAGAREHQVGLDAGAVLPHVGRALADGIAPDSIEGRAVLDRVLPPDFSPAQQARLIGQLEMFTDARVERYWQLLATLNGQPAGPPTVPAFRWLIAALRAHG